MSNFTRPPNQRDPSSPTPATPLRARPTHPSLSQVAVLTSTEDIATARDWLDAWLRSHIVQLSDSRRNDILLATSELLCNALEHGEGECLFDVRRTQGVLVLTVTNTAIGAQILPAEWWTMPDASERSGRGLAIVRAVADAVELNHDTSSVSVSASFDLHTPPPVRRLAAAIAI